MAHTVSVLVIDSRGRGWEMATTNYEDFVRPFRDKASPQAEVVRETAGRAFASELAERQAVGAALAAARKSCGATQQVVADAAGIQQAELSRIENGVSNPTVATLLKILTVLDLRLVFEPADSLSHKP